MFTTIPVIAHVDSVRVGVAVVGVRSETHSSAFLGMKR
jgi:hypothetical protein